MTRPAALGFDVGTTAVKAGLLWLDADEPMVVVSHAYPTSRPQTGWVEQDPADWLVGMAACWEQLVATVGPIELRSVGVCSQVNTHLFVDEDGRPLRPAITWQDTRSAREAAELDAAAADRRDALWGGAFSIDASFSLARLLWLQRHEPKTRSASQRLLLPKDFCIAALTGELSTDPISQIGLVGAHDAYIEGVLDLVDGAKAQLPPLRGFDQPAGATIAGNPVGLPAGAPVAVGTMDAWGSIFGAGLLRPGRGMDVAGTSEIVGVSSLTTAPAEGIVSFPPVSGVHVHAGPTQAGGSALAWVAGLLSMSIEQALAAAEVSARSPQAVVFLPHLAGERAPYWDPFARGVFLGMTASTEPGDLVLAVLEGVAYAVRMLTERCESAAGHAVATMRICGGGARSELWNQVKATTLARPVEVLETLEAGVLGATLLGLVAADLGRLEELIDQHVRVRAVIDTSPGSEGRATDLYSVYADTYQALAPVFPRLSSAG